MSRYDAAKGNEPEINEVPKIFGSVKIEPVGVQISIDPQSSSWVIWIKKEGSKERVPLRNDYSGIRKFKTRMEAEEFCKNIGLS